MPDFETKSPSPPRRTTDDSHTIQTMHEVFSDWDRRAILYCLQEHSGQASIDCVARHLVGWRRGEPDPVSAEEDDVDRIRGHVVYSHVTKMDDFGIVTYDPCTETVELPDDMTVTVTPPWNDHAADA